MIYHAPFITKVYDFNQFQLVDYRVEFSKWWVAEFKTVKFPSQVDVQ